MSQEIMKLDLELLPSSTTTEGNILRGTNSTPLISGLGDIPQVLQSGTLRTRRSSTALMPRQCLFLPPSPTCTSISRLHQIKQEECMDLIKREAMHEWEVQTTMKISRSMEESLNLLDNNLENPSSLKCTDLIPVSSKASITRGIGKVKLHLKISLRDFSKAQPTWLLLILSKCLI
ncbi:P2R1A-PPP2R2A-interacting phosphatase regulator 1 isoform X1 [Rhinolophus sinicus]|uniref:P2R1A-PPP2R2A-interacting phosphatase regulator 1 isoform X1 n=1 Tax=Rhinolophus sinicus TaxID=89399 RepID=UPI003D7BA94C